MNETLESKTKRTSWAVSVGLIACFLVLYGIVNHLPLHRHVIPFWFGENNIPFLPWTFIIYISAFVQGAIAIRYIPPVFLPKALVIALYMVIIGLIFFILFPIEYPRYLYPSANYLIESFRTSDASGNCFPSLHVATTLFLTSTYCLFEKSSVRKTLMWIWSIAIIISVLTTKQHYIVDILGGIILVIPCIFLLQKRFDEMYPNK